MAERIPCPLCGGHESDVQLSTHDRLLDLPGQYDYVRCRACGLTYVHPQPAWPERKVHYALAYRGYHRLESEPSELQRLSMAYGLHKRCRIVAKYVHGGRLLDVGCGGGDFVGWVRAHRGWEAYGLERVAQMARAARKRYGPRIVLGDSLQLGFASAFFDVVTLWTVLEHVTDPAQCLRECARVLRQGGLLVVRTTAADSWGTALFGPCWLGYDAPRVLTVFSKDALRQMFLDAGFRVYPLACYFYDYYPFLWSLRNYCQAHIRSLPLRRCVLAIAQSWAVRLLSLPFFAGQALLGKNSYVTVVAHKR